MADKTHDIWNDDDGEEERPPRRHRLRRFFIFFLTLVAVLAVVLVAAWRDGTGFDALRRFFTYGGAEEGGREVGYYYDASASNRFAALGDSLVVLSRTSLRVLDKSGEEVWSTPVKMESPALAQGGGRAVAYDVGGTELYLVGPEGELFRLTADPEEPFIAATVNEDGYLAVTAKRKTLKGCVTVYDDRQELIFEFKSSQRFVTDAYVTAGGGYLAAVTLGQENSVFVSNVVLYDLTAKAAPAEDDGTGALVVPPAGNYSVSDGLVAAIGQQKGLVATVSDTCLTLADLKGEVEATYAYPGEFLREFDLSGDGFTVLLLNRYKSGSVGRLVTVGADGQEIASLDVNEEVQSVSVAGRYIAVLYIGGLVIYNQDLQVYASQEATASAREALVRPDGSALLLGAESARLFLP